LLREDYLQKTTAFIYLRNRGCVAAARLVASTKIESHGRQEKQHRPYDLIVANLKSTAAEVRTNQEANQDDK
jgi:hypothetical protein